MCGGNSGSSWSFDAMGRPVLEFRINYGSVRKQFNVSYSYKKDGSLTTLTYPSGDILTYTVGGAGRVTQLSDAANNYVGHSGSPAAYESQGSLAAMTNGYSGNFGGIVTSNTYNDRLQPIQLSASGPGLSTSVTNINPNQLCVDGSICATATVASSAGFTVGDSVMVSGDSTSRGANGGGRGLAGRCVGNPHQRGGTHRHGGL